tara:strand:+ start:162 stop:677 length:516 start_codon:yes stop_codon:yes gene_type:complete
MSGLTNGRIAIPKNMINNPGILAPRVGAVQTAATPYVDALTGGWCNTPLANAYFSAKNIDRLQLLLIKGVKERSNGQYVIGKQCEDELKTIMRSVFLQHSKNNGDPIEGQVRELNARVLDYAVGQVYGEAQGYMKYIQDSSTIYNQGTALLPNPSPNDSVCKQLIFGRRGV